MTQITQTFEVHIPENIDIEYLLELFPTSIPNAKDYILFLLSKIQISTSFTNLNSVFLQSYAQHYRPLLNWLGQRGIIESDNIYQKGSKSFGYRFVEGYSVRLKVVLITKKTLVRKLQRLREIEIERNRTAWQAHLEFGLTHRLRVIWISSTDLAARFNLKRNKMLKGFRELRLIDDGTLRDYPSDNSFFYYESINVRGYNCTVLRLNSSLVSIMPNLIQSFPNLFPER